MRAMTITRLLSYGACHGYRRRLTVSCFLALAAVGADVQRRADDVTVWPISEWPFEAGECKEVTSFVSMSGAERPKPKPEKNRQLRGLFDGCLGHSVPYGRYMVEGIAQGSRAVPRFAGICNVFKTHSVCVARAASDNADYFTSTTLRFRLETPGALSQPVWIYVKPAFDFSCKEDLAFDGFRSDLVAFDQRSHAVTTLRPSMDFVVTLISDRSIVGSAHIHPKTSGASYSIAVGDGEIHLRESPAKP